MEPPSEGDRLMARLHESLQQGASLEEAEARLVDMGLDRARAEAVVKEMADEPWRCDICGEHFLKSVKRCGRCHG